MQAGRQRSSGWRRHAGDVLKNTGPGIISSRFSGLRSRYAIFRSCRYSKQETTMRVGDGLLKAQAIGKVMRR